MQQVIISFTFLLRFKKQCKKTFSTARVCCLNKFNALMSCDNEEVVKRTAMYLFYAFEKRQTMFNE